MKQLFNLIFLFGVIAILGVSCSDDNDNNLGGGGIGNGGCVGGPSTVTDVDGNVYNVVAIGNQCWMKENLKVTHYKNGALIPTGLSEAQWQATTSGACADYDNNPTNTAVYGKLYNWYAVADPNGLCPTNWHVPSGTEWDTLVNYLGGDTIAGGAMKEIGLTHWASPNTGATNSSGFTGLPGGVRSDDGTFYSIDGVGIWWSSTESTAYDAWIRGLDCSDGNVYRLNYGKDYGFSVRCLRD